MKLATSHCMHCKRNVLTYWGVPPCADPMTADVGRYCADCNAPLERFGESAEVQDEPLAKLLLEGYRDFDFPSPKLEASCRTNKGCESCSKLSTRPF